MSSVNLYYSSKYTVAERKQNMIELSFIVHLFDYNVLRDVRNQMRSHILLQFVLHVFSTFVSYSWSPSTINRHDFITLNQTSTCDAIWQGKVWFVVMLILRQVKILIPCDITITSRERLIHCDVNILREVRVTICGINITSKSLIRCDINHLRQARVCFTVILILRRVKFWFTVIFIFWKEYSFSLGS